MNTRAHPGTDIIAFFGRQSLSFVPDKQFESITFDAYFPVDSTIVLTTLAEIDRILAPGGKVFYWSGEMGRVSLDLDVIRSVARWCPVIGHVSMYVSALHYPPSFRPAL